MQIVVRQISGLGNQLFQYAAGRYYAKHFGASLRLAIDPARKAHSYGSPRPFLLSHFSITAPYAELTEREHFLLATRRVVRPFAAIYRRLTATEVFREGVSQRFRFPGVPTPRRSTRTLYLAGYWQSQQIVAGVEAELRQELRFREPPQGKDLAVMDQIHAAETPVSLHVRRGDFTLAAEGNIALPLSYYDGAIAWIRERVANPAFFIFSDDIPFTRAHLPRGLRTVFVEHNDNETAFQDLRLMAACRHHIIANSSFSWWGAWLNSTPEKLVYAPRYWQLDAQSYYPGLFPPGWTVGEFPPRG